VTDDFWPDRVVALVSEGRGQLSAREAAAQVLGREPEPAELALAMAEVDQRVAWPCSADVSFGLPLAPDTSLPRRRAAKGGAQ
jgi:hypothetical protein